MPEELNRIAIDAIADLLLCSERSGMENLEKENAPGARVLAGNTMIDTLLRMMPAVQSRANSLELLWDLPFALATLHRPSNVDDPAALRANIAFLAEVAAAGPQVLLVCHHRLKAALESSGITPAWETAHTHEGIRMVEPFPYLQFIRAAQLSAFVLTDSGGLQEEAVLLGKRCFTLRRNTERPSTIESGSNVLVDPAVPADRERVLAFAAKPEDPAVRIPPLWDGNAGARIIDALLAA
jgi:UDP-N-acetylglucosamine 2-epimerase (non-hydrolysing)